MLPVTQILTVYMSALYDWALVTAVGEAVISFFCLTFIYGRAHPWSGWLAHATQGVPFSVLGGTNNRSDTLYIGN